MRNRILSPALSLLPTVLSISSAVAFTSSLAAQSLDYDRKVGAEAAEMVVRTKGLYNDPRLLQFFEKLGKRLVDGLGEQPFTYRFAISNEVEPNAYALPAGFVFATRTLFAVASSEAEVAGVIGHEIIHSHRRHAVKAQKHSILPGILAVPGGLAGIFNEEAGKVLSAPSNLTMAKFSRKNELEADELGVKLAAGAGYDPLALEKCLARLTKTIEIFTGEKEKASYFDDHPCYAAASPGNPKVGRQCQPRRVAADPAKSGGLFALARRHSYWKGPCGGYISKERLRAPRFELPNGTAGRLEDFQHPGGFRRGGREEQRQIDRGSDGGEQRSGKSGP